MSFGHKLIWRQYKKTESYLLLSKLELETIICLQGVTARDSAWCRKHHYEYGTEHWKMVQPVHKLHIDSG